MPGRGQRLAVTQQQAVSGRQRAHAPGLVFGELEALRRLPGPVLPPVLGHVPALGIDQDVLEHDHFRAVLDNDHHFVAADKEADDAED